jgi:PAS domain S-box-containing protein
VTAPLLGLVPIPTAVLRGGTIVFANDELGALVEEAPERLVGQPIARFLPPEELSRITSRHDRRVRGEPEPAFYESVALTTSGRRVPVEVHVAVRDDEIVAQVLDVSERALRRERLDALARLGARVQHERSGGAVLEAACGGLSELGLGSALFRPEGDGLLVERLQLAGLPPEPPRGGSLPRPILAWSRVPELRGAWEDGASFVDDVPRLAAEVLGGEPGARAGELARRTDALRGVAVRIAEARGPGLVLAAAGSWLRDAAVPAFRLFASQVTAALEAAQAIAEFSVRNTELAARNRIVEVSATAPSLAEFFQRGLEVVREALGCDAIAVWLHAPESDELFLGHQFGGTPAMVAQYARMPVSATHLGRVLLEKKAVQFDVEAPGPASSEVIRASGFQSFASVPLLIRTNVVGVLNAAFRERIGPGSGRLELMQVLAGPFAAAVDAQRLLEDLRRRVSELELLSDTALASAALGPGELLQSALPRIAATFRADAAAADMVRDGRLERVATVGISEETLRELAVHHPTSEGPAGEAVRTLQPVTHSTGADASGRYQVLRDREGIVASAAVPITVRGQALGAFVLGRRRPEPFPPREIHLLSGLAAQLGVALENAQLLEDLRRSYGELGRAQRQLVQRERLAALGELSAVLAHEVRNPLAVIFNTLGSLQRMLRPEGDARLLLDVAQEEADRLDRMVGDLLDFTRPVPPDLRPEPLDRVAEEALAAALAPGAEGVTVVRDYDPGMPPVPLDPRQVRQAVLNLAGNAIQAMPRGGTLTVRTRAEAGFALLEVSDTGPGVPPDLRQRIFEPFFTTRAAGTGLGLAVVRRIAEGHGGSVELEDGGAGARFVLRLPLRASVVEMPGGIRSDRAP